jgi:hypothetical protein
MMKNDNKTEQKEAPKRDESLVGGKYHGPSNQAGLTEREYWQMYDAWQDDKYNSRYGY